MDATVVSQGQPIDQVIHIAEAKNESGSWFSDCGTPLKGAKRS
jgi:hypothetical protein